MTPATRTGSLVTEVEVKKFRKLMVAALGSGGLAGLVLFAIQYSTIVPLIRTAETYEVRQVHSGAPLEDEGWQPTQGWQRTSFTALTTTLTGIGFAAMLLGVIALAGKPINTRHGALWGLAAFVCVSLAPALGLPPRPPGVAVADLYQRQLWWAGTVVASGIGLWLLAWPRRTWVVRSCGVVCLVLPHVIGAPLATGQNSVPGEVVRRFAIASVVSSGTFWLLVGTLAGFIYCHGGSMKHDDVQAIER